MAKKPKNPQAENLDEVSGRDLFQTPNYAVDLLIPFLENVFAPGMVRIWECAAGLQKISNRLNHWNYDVISTDLSYEGGNKFNFLTNIMSFPFDCIITNPPFSLKRKFYNECKTYGVPFALLIPADYSGWIIDAVRNDGAEKIIPSRRIDYITPNTLKRIWEGETWNSVSMDYSYDLEDFKKVYPEVWEECLSKNICKFDSIYDAPSKLLRKYSSSYFHSMWLTWGFGIGKSETFVELTNEMKDNI